MADENRTINELSAGAGMLGYHNALPFSPEAEQSVLGAILLDSSCLDRVAEILPRPEYFHQVNNSLIYGAMLEMFTLGQPVDFITVLEKLKESKSFDEASIFGPTGAVGSLYFQCRNLCQNCSGQI